MLRVTAISASLLFAALQGAGCASGAACSIANPSWPYTLEPMLPDGHEPNSELRVDADGRILWRSFMGGAEVRAIPLTEFREMLPIIDSMNPRPWLIVRADDNAPCETVAAVRSELDRLSMCTEGRCVEGEAWDRFFGRGPAN